MLTNLLKFVGLRHQRLRPARSILTTLGVAFGIALFVAISIINRATRDSLRENVESVAGKAKITVSAGPTGFAEEKLDLVKSVPGVKHAVPLVESRAFFETASNQDEAVYVIGVDLLQESAVRTYKTTDQKIVDDPLIFLNQPDSIVVTKKFADERGLKLDSKLPLATANGAKTFTVRGLLEPEGAARAFGGGLAVMDIDGARVSFGKVGKIDRIDIVPDDGVPADTVIAAIRAKLGSGFSIERPETQAESTERMIAAYQKMITFFSSLALLVGLFLVFNSVSISVAERRREIGILRALGAARKGILSVFVLESALMGLVGAALGTVLGRFLAEFMVKQVTLSIAAQFHTAVQANNLDLTKDLVVVTLLLGTLTSAAAALIPAYRASRISPLEAMKTRGLEAGPRERSDYRSVLLGAAFLAFTYFSTRGHWNQIFHPFEQMTQAASVLGAAFFGPFVVFILIRIFRRAIRAQRAPIFRLAQDNLLRSRRRTAANIMALMVGLFLVMLIATVRASFQDTIVGWLQEILVADIVVTGSGRTITAEVQPVKEEIAKEILAVPGVRDPGPGRGVASRILQIDTDGVKYTLKAFDEPGEWVGFRNFKIKGQDLVETARKLYDREANLREPTILVSDNYFLKHPNVKVGDLLELDTPTGRKGFRILGKTVDYASPNGVFYLARETYRRIWNDNLVTGFALSLVPGADLETVRSGIAKAVGRKYNLVALSNAEMRREMKVAIDDSFAYTRAVEGAALLVALLGLLNTLLISILERTRELGVLRAVGSSRRQIFRMILGEAVIQGGFGAVVAVAIGGAVGKLWIENSLAYALGWMIEFSIPFSSVVQTIGVGVVVSAIAGIYPSKRASDLPIVEALDYE
ncbi:MAG: FtsX-like permease family protein [Bdellovibrionales bacterium]|nr:FtsX-like permease family protein [Bdellovibrionales bacterium]